MSPPKRKANQADSAFLQGLMDATPITPACAKQIVDDDKSFSDTDAGQFLQGEINKLKARLEKELNDYISLLTKKIDGMDKVGAEDLQKKLKEAVDQVTGLKKQSSNGAGTGNNPVENKKKEQNRADKRDAKTPKEKRTVIRKVIKVNMQSDSTKEYRRQLEEAVIRRQERDVSAAGHPPGSWWYESCMGKFRSDVKAMSLQQLKALPR